VLGTIAGDDTILVVPRDGVRRTALVAALRARIPGLGEGGV
jgi:arginine repressor